jgi:hypothetical protein
MSSKNILPESKSILERTLQFFYGIPTAEPLNPEESKKNFFLGVTNGVLFTTSEALLDPTLVLVTFIGTLTNSPILMGLVVPIRAGLWAFPQLLVSGWLQNLPHKLTVYRWTTFLRIVFWGLIALTINLVRDPLWLLISFFTVFTVSSFMNGLGGLPYLEVVGKTVPSERRGEFFALRMGIGGLGGIFSSLLVRWILAPSSPLKFPQNYGLLSFLFFVGASVACLIFNAIKEPVDTTVQPRQSLLVQIKRSFETLKTDHIFRKFMVMNSTLIWANAATPFFAIYVQQQLGGNKAFIGVYLGVITVANLVANVILGKISRKIGYRKIMFLAVFCGFLMSLAVLFLAILAKPLNISAQLASYCLIPVYILSGFRNMGLEVGGNSLLLEIAPVEQRSLYIGFTNSLIGLVTLSLAASGLILQLFNFQILVGLTLVMGMISLINILRVAKST